MAGRNLHRHLTRPRASVAIRIGAPAVFDVDDAWPDYWLSVDAETAKVGTTRAVYLADDHDHVVETFARHWDILERLVDDPALDYVRSHVFDGDQLRFRFRVIGAYGGGVIRLLEYKIMD